MPRRLLPLALGAVLCACGGEAPVRSSAAERSGAPPDAPPARAPVEQPAEPIDLQAAHGLIRLLVDSVDTRLRTVSNLSGEERRSLRRDVNERQLERARRLGVRPGTPLHTAVGAGQLVELADTTANWALRELDFSEPFVTPATEALLVEVSRRFHARLDSLGVPRYRVDITSVLRTPEKQAALRRANANASRVESAHEFGTTVDIAYRRYAPPATYDGGLGDHPVTRALADSLMAETARLRGAELQALLGRVLLELQREGKVLVRMERSQTVYHITVGRRLPNSRRQG